jgi:hypothetical protein
MHTSNNIQIRSRHQIVLLLTLVGLIGTLGITLSQSRSASAQANASWNYTGNLNFARVSHTATLPPTASPSLAAPIQLWRRRSEQLKPTILNRNVD